MAKAPASYRVRILTTMPLAELAGLTLLFDALADLALTPTHQGADERAREPFDQAALAAAIVARPHAFALARRKTPTYSASISAQPAGELGAIQLDFPGSQDAAAVFAAGDRLAEVFHAEHGLVHPTFDGEGQFNSASVLEAGRLQQYGLKAPGARTWYGAHLRELVGEARLASAGGVLRETAWGALCLDLVAAPERARFTTLARRQREAFAALSPSGAFGDYNHPVIKKPGPQWRPIPADRNSVGSVRGREVTVATRSPLRGR